MLNTTNAEYSSIEVWFTDQSSEPLEIEDNVNMTLIIAKLLGYSKNYKKPTGNLWNYYRDEPNDFPANNYNANPITDYESFKQKTSITGKTSNANQENGENTEQENTKTKKNLETVVPLKHLSNFWRTLDMPLINCEINLILTWSENCVLTDIITQTANPNVDPAIPANASANATFKITDTKLYVPAVTLSIEHDNKFLKTGFKRTIKWNNIGQK